MSKSALGNTNVTISGVASVDKIKVAGNVITLTANALNGKKVTVSGDYKLELDDGLQTSTAADIWSVKSTTAARTSGTTAYYELDGKTITYKPATTVGNAVVTVSGGNFTKK